ncbi:hypothetical protein F5Y04DRAFT_291306 [Hypomontagnella monticulosa]|nr:hypothetical protein F5Y04DRAFT_291306 [Hypomontagnella monticulosa]
MCFTEYLGYTCGHMSLPVKRTCPLTTQLHSNPCCPNSASRPILAMTMCPACARILHGRYVDIIEREHRFMHERGACHCGVIFPHLQEPHVVEHTTSNASSGDQNDVDMSESPSHSPNGSSSESASPAGSPGTDEDHENGGGDTPPLPSFRLDPVAPEFTPSGIQPQGQDPNEGASASDVQEDKGKGKETEEPQQMPNDKEDHRDSPPTTAQGAPRLAPLFEQHEEKDGPGISVSVRSRSLYGAEWCTDHAELHRGGQCSCEISFDRYPGQYMPMLQEAYGEISDQTELNGENADTNADSVTTTFEWQNTSDQGDENGGPSGSGSGDMNMEFDVEVTIDFDGFDSMDPAPATASGSRVIEPTGMIQLEPPVEEPTNLSSRRRRRAARNRARAQARAQAQAQARPPTPPVQWMYSPHSLDVPHHNEPARWACHPYDTTNMQSFSEGNITYEENLADILNHPVDYQTFAYQQTDTPIAGLPIGAGPEGDSHMPPFEDCELCYPKIPRDRRPASH